VPLSRRAKLRLARLLLPKQELERFMALETPDAGHGYDALGLERESFVLGAALSWAAYRRYFRVQSYGSEHLPRTGGAILAANHSGFLPTDGAMLAVDVARRSGRVPRVIGDVFIPFMPWLGALFSRMGVVSGNRENFRYLLESGELVIVFPEGTPGIGKGFKRRYQLQPFRVGHAELALKYQVPVIPAAIVGAEEAWMQIARIDGVHAFGAPYLPIPATPLPLPTRYHLRYGAPIHLHEELAGADPDDPRVTRVASEKVQSAVAALLEQSLRERKGWFR
jgi:1-acyl-sn-glycerol-3-phosphate acyltransferase